MIPGWHNKILLDLYYLEQKALKVHFIHLLHIALVIKQTTSRKINQSSDQDRSTCKINDPIDMRLLARLCLDISQLNERKFRHTFRNTASSLCDCSSEM